MYLRLCTLLVSATLTSLSLHECALETFPIAQTLPHIDIRAQCTRDRPTIDAICGCIAAEEANYVYIVHNWHRFTPERQRYCSGFVAGCLQIDRPITYTDARDCLEPPQSIAHGTSRLPLHVESHASLMGRVQSDAGRVSPTF